MKLNYPKKLLALAWLLAGGFSAAAQSNGVPGDADYSKFSAFITQRNIFDPNRYAHEVRSTYHPRPQHHNAAAPVFTLVGTMNYGEGRFAFFSGNNYDVKKVLETNGVIAGYTVTGIMADGVILSGTSTNTITMKLGDQMRQENNGWQLVIQGDTTAGLSGGGTAPSSSAEPTSTPATPAPSAAVNSNDVLKRLMELRKKASQ